MKLNYNATHFECFLLCNLLSYYFSIARPLVMMMVADTSISTIPRFNHWRKAHGQRICHTMQVGACLKLGTVPKTVNGHHKLSFVDRCEKIREKNDALHNINFLTSFLSLFEEIERNEIPLMLRTYLSFHLCFGRIVKWNNASSDLMMRNNYEKAFFFPRPLIIVIRECGKAIKFLPLKMIGRNKGKLKFWLARLHVMSFERCLISAGKLKSLTMFGNLKYCENLRHNEV